MPRLSSAEVFTPTSYPTHTYVVRDDLHHERLLREWIRSSTQIASISGPSKAGKTVLVQRGRLCRGDRSIAGVDEAAQTIVVPDPYLLFYLRWSVVLEREADALT